MHGPGYAPQPPQPSQGTKITLRVLFVALAVLSCGFLAWASLLRLAVVTRKTRDWVVFALAIAHITVVFAMLLSDPGEAEFTTWRGNGGMWLLLCGMVAIVAYYLAAEIRHFSPLPAPPFTQPTGYSPHQTGYGYPGPQPFPPAPPVQPQPVPPQPQAHPQPQRPAPARIDQVRAELDELSDYLRKHEDGR